MLVITIGDIIGIIIGIIIITVLALMLIKAIIIDIYFKKSKKWKNCYECENYHLKDVAGAGDRCWYKCKIHNYEDAHSMNDCTMYRKCKNFKAEEKTNEM